MEADDKCLLGLSMEATEHLVEALGTDCLAGLKNECKLCDEIRGEATAAITAGKEPDERGD